MVEGRKTQVTLIDGRQLDIVVQPRLSVAELLTIVASHCHLKEPDKKYFGLAFMDEKHQFHWLQKERRTLDHDFPRKFTVPGATLTLYHLIKLFVDSITHLAHPSTVELFFMYASSQVYRGLIYANSDSIFRLAALYVHIYCGDFFDRQAAVNCLRRLPLFPSETLKLHTLKTCEEKVLEIYCELQGMSCGLAILKYMECVEKLPTYGVHFFDVKDKAGNSYNLAVSKSGIFQYPAGSRAKPVKGFHWRQLENLYYRERKFSVEVQEAKRVVHTVGSLNLYDDVISETIDENDDLTLAVRDPTTQVSVSRRAFLPSHTKVYVFYCDTPQLCKSVWSLAVAQHEFSSDRKVSHKTDIDNCLSCAALTFALSMAHPREGSDDSGVSLALNPPDQLVQLLNCNLNSIKTTVVDQTASPAARRLLLTDRSTSDSGLSISSQSVQSAPYPLVVEKTDEERKTDRARSISLKAKKTALEKQLIEKLAELKKICIDEGNIIGHLPQEIKQCLVRGEPEPKVQRRVGTSFSIPFDLINKSTKVDHIQQLEADIEIQKKIVTAALKLANDSAVSKVVRKARMNSHNAAQSRLKVLDQQLLQLRLSSSKPDISRQNHASDESEKILASEPARFTKSAPSTPMGSSADLTSADDQIQTHRGKKIFVAPKPPQPCSTQKNLGVQRPPNLPLAYRSNKRTAAALNVQPSDEFCIDSMFIENSTGSTKFLSPLNLQQSDEHCSTLGSPDLAPGYQSNVTYRSSYQRRHFPTLIEHTVASGTSTSAPNYRPTFGGGNVPTSNFAFQPSSSQAKSTGFTSLASSSPMGRCVVVAKPLDSHERQTAVTTSTSLTTNGGGKVAAPAVVPAAPPAATEGGGVVTSFRREQGGDHAVNGNVAGAFLMTTPSASVVSQRCRRRVVGAYNLPNRRTSWDYDGLGVLMSSSESLDGAAAVGRLPPSVGTANAASVQQWHSAALATFTPASTAGSLDRRMLRSSRGGRTEIHLSPLIDPHLTSLLASNTSILSLDHSPPRYGQQNRPGHPTMTSSPVHVKCGSTSLHISGSPALHRPNNQMNSGLNSHRRADAAVYTAKKSNPLRTGRVESPQSGGEGSATPSSPGVVVESSKPYETTDVLKYSERFRRPEVCGVKYGGREFCSSNKAQPIRNVDRQSTSAAKFKGPAAAGGREDRKPPTIV